VYNRIFRSSFGFWNKYPKIEGRGRSPEYVKTTTQSYREAADAYLEGTYNKEKVKGWIIN
jgi:putative protease